jgi:hypothetical protein
VRTRIGNGISMFVTRGWRGDDCFAFPATARSNMPDKSK